MKRSTSGQQPGQVVGRALDHGPHQVLPGGVQGHVEEAATGLPVRRRGDRARPARAGTARHRHRGRGGQRHLEVGERTVEQGHPVLHRLARQAVLGPGQVAAGDGAGHRDQLGVQVDPLVGHGVEDHRRRPHVEAAAPGSEDPTGQGAGGAVVHPHPDLDALGQAQGGGRPGAHGPHHRVDPDQLGQSVPIDARQAEELVVVGGDPDRTVVAELGRELRVLGAHGPTGEAGHDQVHRLQVVGRGGVDLGAVPLEVEQVPEGQPAADGRDAVDLDEALEGLRVLGHDRPAVVGPPLVVVHRHRGHGVQGGVHGDDRRVLAADPDGPHRGVGHLRHRAGHRGPEGLGVLFDDLPVPPGDQRSPGGRLQPTGLVDPGHLDVRAPDVDAEGRAAHQVGSACWSSIMSVITARMNSSASGVMPPGIPP